VSGLTVLVVDDEQDILDLLEIWLSDDARCGEVLRADNVDDALALGTSRAPEVVVLDFFIGKSTSVEILPALRQACPGAKIIVHTASRQAAEAAGALAAGADFVIEKNQYTIDALIERLLDPVESRRSDSAS